MLSNPQYFPEEKHVTTLSQSDTEAVVQDSIWQDGSVLPVLTAKLDIPENTLEITLTDPNGSTSHDTEQLPDTDKLKAELKNYYNRKYASPASSA